MKAGFAAVHKYGMTIGGYRNFKPFDKSIPAEIALMIRRVYASKTGMKHTASVAPYTDFGNYYNEKVNTIRELDLTTGSNAKFNLTKSSTCCKSICEITG